MRSIWDSSSDQGVFLHDTNSGSVWIAFVKFDSYSEKSLVQSSLQEESLTPELIPPIEMKLI